MGYPTPQVSWMGYPSSLWKTSMASTTMGKTWTLSTTMENVNRIIRDIVSDFSDEDEIEFCGEEEEDVEVDSNEGDGNVTYANPSSFFRVTDSEGGRDY
ncbi:unnamed protein product [Lupinus luteus]|uniref:Uncharacterized protein n=1 Tax=Lupinus luteus TaxID=3873 RepID=A0AAV1VR05_LUPLU